MTVSFNISVPALPDGQVWFANAQAWTNYWAGVVSGNATIDPITTTVYAPVALVDAGPVDFLVDGTNYYLVQDSTFQSLVAKVSALDTMFQTLRQQMKDAGLITEAQ